MLLFHYTRIMFAALSPSDGAAFTALMKLQKNNVENMLFPREGAKQQST